MAIAVMVGKNIYNIGELVSNIRSLSNFVALKEDSKVSSQHLKLMASRVDWDF